MYNTFKASQIHAPCCVLLGLKVEAVLALITLHTLEQALLYIPLPPLSSPGLCPSGGGLNRSSERSFLLSFPV